METLNRLKKLTEELPEIPTLKQIVHNPGNIRSYIEYEVDNGTSIGFGLLSQQEVAVQKLFLSSGSEFPPHKHDVEKEYGIIFEGEVEVDIEGQKQILKKGDCVEFCCNKTHSARAITDTWLIAVAIPAIQGYPKYL